MHSGIDEVTFSIDGARPESYVQYRQRGKFDVAMRNLRAMADEKRRPGRDLPYLNWRYILFKWNDSDEEMAEARRLAADLGVDRLCWEITDHPEDSFSRRFVPGIAGLRGDPARDVGRQQPGQRHSRGDATRAHRGPRALAGVPGIPLVAPAPAVAACRTRVHNLSTRPFPADATYGRRLVRLGAQLCGPTARSSIATSRAPGCPAPWPGSAADITIEIPPFERPGRYALKFDLVSEGVEWFEKCGSPTTMKPLWIR